jgi:hypothetical protein
MGALIMFDLDSRGVEAKKDFSRTIQPAERFGKKIAQRLCI